MTLEENLGKIINRLMFGDITYVQVSKEKTVFKEAIYYFKIAKTKNNQVAYVKHMATQLQLESLADPNVVADAILEDVKAQLG